MAKYTVIPGEIKIGDMVRTNNNLVRRVMAIEAISLLPDGYSSRNITMVSEKGRKSAVLELYMVRVHDMELMTQVQIDMLKEYRRVQANLTRLSSRIWPYSVVRREGYADSDPLCAIRVAQLMEEYQAIIHIKEKELIKKGREFLASIGK